MRFLVVGTLLVLTSLACDDEVTPPPNEPTEFSFASRIIPSITDSSAYVHVVAPGTIEIVGFYTGCVYQIAGRLVRSDSLSIVVDADISQCNVLCIRNVDSRYTATLTGVSPGSHRVILEILLRDCISGQLVDFDTEIDTLVAVPVN